MQKDSSSLLFFASIFIFLLLLWCGRTVLSIFLSTNRFDYTELAEEDELQGFKHVLK